MILSNVKQKWGPLPPGSALNLNKLNLIETELFIKCFMESGLLYNPTMKQQPGMMTGRRSETFEDLLYLFSSEDKYEGFSLY